MIFITFQYLTFNMLYTLVTFLVAHIQPVGEAKVGAFFYFEIAIALYHFGVLGHSYLDDFSQHTVILLSGDEIFYWPLSYL